MNYTYPLFLQTKRAFSIVSLLHRNYTYKEDVFRSQTQIGRGRLVVPEETEGRRNEKTGVVEQVRLLYWFINFFLKVVWSIVRN